MKSSSPSVLLLGYTDSFPLVTSRCCMLTTYTKSPVMSQTAVCFDLLQPLQILTQFVLQSISEDLRVFSIFDVFRSIQVVVRNLILSWILHDGDQSLNFFITQFTCTFVHIDVSFLQTDVAKPSTHSFDGRHRVHDL